VTIAQTLSKEAEGAKAAAAKTEKTQPAFLELDVAPPQASVSLGTIQAGTGESLRAQGKVPVLPGNYELFVSLPGYKPYIENVQLEAGQVLSKRIRLEPLVPAEAR
jgi:hypothetical protein